MGLDRRLELRRIAQLALLTSAAVVGRWLFAFVPNVQPVTSMVIFISLIYGMCDGALVGMLTMLVSNLFLGMGWWTIPQMLAYALIAVLSALWGKTALKNKRIMSAIWAAAMGYFYGIIVTLAQILHLGLANGWIYYLNGLSFDTYHALGNVAFYLLLLPIFPNLLQRFDYRKAGKSA
ncbi:ECF transporter S component [Atopobacter sp. AH10]|uniref:ECF transporter S component n=1 Tax=Atopobacter sp. AH10 TaxID=2315861 RepID=UPI000EF1D341|nr:ECF transporter S component [Atopobacter sp. AH10]RLK62741.1 ECF transporter S component [Atopobacter sp. AH10]